MEECLVSCYHCHHLECVINADAVASAADADVVTCAADSDSVACAVGADAVACAVGVVAVAVAVVTMVHEEQELTCGVQTLGSCGGSS